MQVKITDFGFSKTSGKYYVIYKITDITEETKNKLKDRVEDELTDKSGVLYVTLYFDEKYFPFNSDEASWRMADFIAREEIEMTAYILSILED